MKNQSYTDLNRAAIPYTVRLRHLSVVPFVRGAKKPDSEAHSNPTRFHTPAHLRWDGYLSVTSSEVVEGSYI